MRERQRMAPQRGPQHERRCAWRAPYQAAGRATRPASADDHRVVVAGERRPRRAGGEAVRRERRLGDLAVQVAMAVGDVAAPRRRSSTPRRRSRSASRRYSGSAVGREVVGHQRDGHGQRIRRMTPGLLERTDPAQPVPRARRRGALGRGDRSAAASARSRRRGAGALERRAGRASRPRARRCGDAGRRARPGEVERAVRRTGAEVVHAHNIHPLWGARALAAARRAGARGRHAPPQLPAVLRDRRSSIATARCAPAAGAQHASRACGCAAAGTFRRRPPTGPASLRQQPPIVDAVGPLRGAERVRGASGSRSSAWARDGDRGRCTTSCATASSPPRRPRAAPRTRCSPAGWSRRRGPTRRSRRPRSPESRWRSPAPARRRERLERSRAARARRCTFLGRLGAAQMRAALRARGVRARPLALGRAMPVLRDRGDGGGRPVLASERGGLPEMVGRRAHAADRASERVGGRDACPVGGPAGRRRARAVEALARARAAVRRRPLLRRADGRLRGARGPGERRSRAATCSACRSR